jgi:hypothetical protein
LSKEFLEELDAHLQKENISEINTRVVERDGRVVVLIGSAEIREVRDWAIV